MMHDQNHIKVKMELQEVGWGNTDWINLAQDGKVGGRFWLRQWTLRFHKILGISRLSEGL